MSEKTATLSIDDWLGASEGYEVATNVDESEYGGDAIRSEYGYGDDEARYRGMLNDVVEDDEELLVPTVEAALSAAAQAEQRIVARSLFQKYTRGRVHVDYDYVERPVKGQRKFQVTAYVDVANLDSDPLFDRISRGPVVTRVGMPTGAGKTRKFAGAVAVKCSKRVCYVGLTALQAAEVLEFQKGLYGIRGSSRTWSRKPGAFLGAISYHDFNGIVRSAGYKRFFSDFDVFVFDEPHVMTSAVYCAKQFFAAYAGDTTSLLMISATASTFESNNVVATKVGKFDVEPVRGGMAQLKASGLLLTKYCVDRTVVIVPDERDVAEYEAYYYEGGCDVRLFDRGSNKLDKDAIFQWLTPEERATPRILVTTEQFGTGTNFPLSYAITSATRKILAITPTGGLEEREVPLRAVEVQQHKGRTGRGLATGSGGIVASAAIADMQGEIMECEKYEAYATLVAGCIKPSAKVFTDAEKWFPRGLMRHTANNMLSIELPTALVVRYLGTDGRVAKRFVAAMQLFAQCDHKLLPSCDMDPVGYDSWLEEHVGGYNLYDDNVLNEKVFVPFQSPPSLRVAMHTLYAVSKKWIWVDSWTPGYQEVPSDDEDMGVKRVSLRRKEPVKLRLIVEPEEEPEVQPVVEPSWSYDVEPSVQEKRYRRRAMSWIDTEAGRESVDKLKSGAGKAGVIGTGSPTLVKVVDQGVSKVQVPTLLNVAVETPGGTPVMLLAERSYGKMVDGVPLQPGEFMELVLAVKTVKDKFVRSTIFENWTPVWVSILYSVAVDDCLSYAVAKGYGGVVARLVAAMYDRFRAEALAVCSSSNLYKKSTRDVFSSHTFSVTRLYRKIKDGSIPIAQSDSFKTQFLKIRDAHVDALAALERHGVYAPNVVTKMQEKLPLRSVAKRRVIDSELRPPDGQGFAQY